MIKRGDIYYADLSPVIGSEQGGLRPVLIVQNDVGNKYSPTVIAAAITSQVNKSKLPTHIELNEILTWACYNGAKAIGFESTLGSFEQGKKPGVVLIDNIDWENMKLTEKSSSRRLV